MRKRFNPIERLTVLLLPASLAAAEKASAVVIVADSRHLTGIRAWWANLYNESHMNFTLLTIVMVPIAGVILGSVADFLIGRLGIDLKSRVLREG